jgi:parallel beta helix pectate lyase-like protein
MRKAAAAVVIGSLALAAPAMATKYPPAKDPPGVQKAPKGPHHTLKVGKHARFKTIQAAVKAAKAGDTIRVSHGTYKGQVKISGAAKRYLQIIGDVKHPNRVIVELKGQHGAKAQNGFFILGADQVRVAGIQAQHYKANGFFALNVKGYKFDHDIAKWGGTYGIYAFNSYGGVISDSVGAWNNDSGFYIGQTPPQTHPTRSIATRLKAYGNVIGWSGTNMRYVTITKSQFWNNGTGIVPNTEDTEKFPPPSDNVIANNQVFWNNFNYYLGAPFKREKTQVGGLSYPVGVGILLYGGHNNTVENNNVYGNWLSGIAGIQAVTLKNAALQTLVGNKVINNQLGLGGQDLNGYDLYYEGDGSDNCFSGNTPSASMLPANGSTFAACPFSGPNAFDSAAQQQAIGWAVNPDHEAAWQRHPHVTKKGYLPLEHWTAGRGDK